jgi:hypothetical protein
MLIDITLLSVESDHRRAVLLSDAENFRLARLARTARRAVTAPICPPRPPSRAADRHERNESDRDDGPKRRYAVSR